MLRCIQRIHCGIALLLFPAHEPVKELPAEQSTRCIGVSRASRRAQEALLSIRGFFDGINGIPYSEEAAF